MLQALPREMSIFWLVCVQTAAAQLGRAPVGSLVSSIYDFTISRRRHQQAGDNGAERGRVTVCSGHKTLSMLTRYLRLDAASVAAKLQ